MEIGAIQHEHFSKTFTYRESPKGYYRDRQSSRVIKGSADTYTKHNGRNQRFTRVIPENERSSTGSKKSNEINFEGYKSPLKKLWKKGYLPNVTRGLYGDILTKQNVSLDHLLPVSKGGKTVLSNLALASKAKNEARGNKDLKEVLTRQQAMEYIKQFAPYKDFRNYITDILRTFEKLGVIK